MLSLILLLTIGAFAQILGPIVMTQPPVVSGGGATFVASGFYLYPGPATITTTGATLLVAVTVSDNATCLMTDTQSNTWNYIAGSTSSGTGITQIAYAYANGGSPLSTGTDRFIPSCGGQYPAFVVFAFGSTLTTSSVYAGNTANAGLQASPLFAGSITPAATNLVITGIGGNLTNFSAISVSSPFTGLTAYTVASSDSVAGAYILNAAGTALNPHWQYTDSGNEDSTAISAAFATQ